MSHLAFCNLCLNEGCVVKDASHSTSYPAQMMPSIPVSHSHRTHVAKVSPCPCWICLPKLIHCAWVNGWYVMNSVTLGARWGCLPWAMGCLCFTLCCTTGLTDKQGPTGSSSFITYSLRQHGPQSHATLALVSVPVVLLSLPISAVCTLAQHHRENSLYSPSSQPTKSTSQCEQQYVLLCLASESLGWTSGLLRFPV